MKEELEQKPRIIEPAKSSMEILSELFSTFDAVPPIIIKKEKEEQNNRKHKKSKKKHKHKDKKQKKKDKKRKRNHESSSSENSEIDLAKLLIEQERQSPEKKIKIEEDLSISNIKLEENMDSKKNVNVSLAEVKTEKEATEDTTCKSPKIKISNLKFSSIFEAAVIEAQQKEKTGQEEGELSDGPSDHGNDNVIRREKRKKKHKDDEVKKKRKLHSHSNKSESGSKKKPSPIRFMKESDELKNKSRESKSDYYKSSSRHRSKEKHNDHRYKARDKDGYSHREKKSNSRSKSYDETKYYKRKENPFYKDENNHKIKEEHGREREHEEKWFMRDRYRGHTESERDGESRHRGRSNSRDRIDKKKLLEIARRNAIQMMKSGNLPAALTLGPQAQEKVLAAIRAGGKTIEELTDFCKTLSKKEELGELSSVSGDEDREDSDIENRAFHHPFQLKDRPTAIVMNIKNSVPLPTKTAQERTSELRMLFPVSSGSQHRKTENEWVPVRTKKVEVPAAAPAFKVPAPVAPPLPIEAPPPAPVAAPDVAQVFSTDVDPNIDIGSVVSERLQAMRKLQENPYDVQALKEMHKSQKKMQSWAESKQQPGQFTGSTGANILTQAELAAGFQAWARKDQLQNAAPVSGGMGMHLLKKMGWNPGEGLGKEKSGALEPLLLEVKLDKKGLVANEEQKRRQLKAQKQSVKTLEGKHPVSLLGEYTAKRKLGAPQYNICMESGPDHKKVFLFKVIVNGVEFQPDAASPNKKQAKADAAKLCLQRLGLLPS